MPPNNWQKVKDIFEQAMAITPDERRHFLDKVCSDNKIIRREVEELLSSYDESDSFLETPAIPKPENEFHIGQTFAHYKIIKMIGAGGMGKVYLARDTKLDRQAAIKLLNHDLSQDNDKLKRFIQEAKAASSLNHPNILTVYEIGETDNLNYIVTEFIEGKTLRELLSSTELMPLNEILTISIQISEALSVAHQAGIIHRDIKPENIMLRHDGLIKILDFGLAKLNPTEAAKSQTEIEVEINVKTQTGLIMGTASYMSPEQARCQTTDARTDIFSFGVMLYEMISGRKPFVGESIADVLSALIKSEPLPLNEIAPNCPVGLQNIVNRALRKNRDERYQTMKSMLTDLKSLKQELDFAVQLKHTTASEILSISDKTLVTQSYEWRKYRKLFAGIAIVLFFLVGAGIFLLLRHNANLSWAQKNVGRIESLAKERKFFEAYDLAIQVQNYLPDDEKIKRLMPIIADELSVTTEPSGAKIYLKRYSPDSSGNFPARELIGTAPLEKNRIPRGSYILYLEKEGYAPIARAFSGMPEDYWNAYYPPPIQINVKLKPFNEVPENMTFVPGGEYSLVSWRKPTSSAAKLDDFLIDKYEVTNREYQEFIRIGGYYKKEFWKYPFIKNGKTLTFEEAMSEFKDRTGLPAPRSWVNQTYPDGKAEYPITDITWYEAAAYAEFRGKSLPTIYQWEKAARDGFFTQGTGEVLPWGTFQKGDSLDYRANISGKGSMPVNSFEFGISPYGCFNMAGNVAEWCQNQLPNGFATAGGSWGDPQYNFGSITGFPAFYVSNKLGFRCVKNLGTETGDAKFEENDEIPVYQKSSEKDFRSWLGFYRYDKTPLEANIIEVKETAEWRREKISFLGANDETVLAYLYLPKNYKQPLQVIQYVPAGDVFGRFVSLPEHIETFMSPYIKSGRAVFAVVLEGFIEREYPPEYKPAPESSIKFRDEIVSMTTDTRRGLDYLETRDDIDHQQIIYWGYSAGAEFGLIFAAVETRYRAMVLTAAGLSVEHKNWIAEANKANFAPHIKIPKLMLHGRYDEQFPWKSEAEPLFKLFSEPKHLVLYDGGHTPSPEISVPIISKWLDETIGAVKHD